MNSGGTSPEANARCLDVLVVDDDEDTCELIAHALSASGHRCRIAVDGLAALRLLDERPADVVVSDWDMPNMNGAELCRRVRSASCSWSGGSMRPL